MAKGTRYSDLREHRRAENRLGKIVEVAVWVDAISDRISAFVKSVSIDGKIEFIDQVSADHLLEAISDENEIATEKAFRLGFSFAERQIQSKL
ncbi:hypothetical protein [Lysobacter sp. CA196]|uniref:hypothetical protein n=1 Tax=Lysobacter sp. CA196 TaxID=3455606 RepID=UPI003F8D4C3A